MPSREARPRLLLELVLSLQLFLPMQHPASQLQVLHVPSSLQTLLSSIMPNSLAWTSQPLQQQKTRNRKSEVVSIFLHVFRIHDCPSSSCTLYQCPLPPKASGSWATHCIASGSESVAPPKKQPSLEATWQCTHAPHFADLKKILSGSPDNPACCSL